MVVSGCLNICLPFLKNFDSCTPPCHLISTPVFVGSLWTIVPKSSKIIKNHQKSSKIWTRFTCLKCVTFLTSMMRVMQCLQWFKSLKTFEHDPITRSYDLHFTGNDLISMEEAQDITFDIFEILLNFWLFLILLQILKKISQIDLTTGSHPNR